LTDNVAKNPKQHDQEHPV
jgi:hypothetical protein